MIMPLNALIQTPRNIAVRSLKSTLEHLRPASERRLCYIHIGKCGGATVNKAIDTSPLIAEAFDHVSVSHVARPVYKPRNRYLFVVRNPIDRAISAFNWRQRLVHEEARPDHRFPGEAEVLTKYGTLEALALALYDGDSLVPEVASEFRRIHHLREDMAFYLDPAIPVLSADQVFAVLCQETLDADIEARLGVPTPGRVHDNRSRTATEKTVLSPAARANLARFLDRDFAALEWLMTLFPLREDQRDALLKH
ncbi:MAG: hypothetical protein AAGL23_08315 [Pseudomonadota bacterium]